MTCSAAYTTQGNALALVMSLCLFRLHFPGSTLQRNCLALVLSGRLLLTDIRAANAIQAHTIRLPAHQQLGACRDVAWAALVQAVSTGMQGTHHKAIHWHW